MARFRFSLGLALAVSLLAWQAQAGHASRAWPRITQAKDAKACRQALLVAKLAFDSKAAKLAKAANAILNGEEPAFGILLAPDNCEGHDDDFIIDETAIERKGPDLGEYRPVMIQRTPASGARFAVTQQKMNWQGDWYGLYLVNADIGTDTFIAALGHEKEKAGASIAFEKAWQRPWLIRDPDSRKVVGIDTRHPANFLYDWIVYAPANGKLTRACTIAFRPRVERAADLLPAGPLRRLAILLDTIIGIPAQDEGTLHATDRVHIAAADAVANLALRPWAVPEPYNSVAEIERGLLEWSGRSPVYAAQYRQVKALYPQALRALTAHYRASLTKPPKEAAELARHALARAYGAHFVFPRGAGENVEPLKRP